MLQGSIGDPGPAGYSGMKVKCTYINKSDEDKSSNVNHWRQNRICENLNLLLLLSIISEVWDILFHAFSPVFIFLCENSDVFLSVSRETVVSEERRCD